MDVAGESAQDTAARIIEEIGAMPDITIECSGAESAIQTGIYVDCIFEI